MRPTPRLLLAAVAAVLAGCGGTTVEVQVPRSSATLMEGPSPECLATPAEGCTTQCGSLGTCSDSNTPTCQPPAESCGNGADDDCDGLADGQDPDCQVCTPGQRRGCATECGSGGTEECGADGLWGGCRVPTEQCENGSDDDCDGRVDHGDTDCTPVIHTCEATEGGGCNGDPGYGDRCAPSENTGGCSAARFWAWCNRRNPEYPNIWDDWIRNWVDSRCDGPLAETGTQYSTWYCTSSSNDRYECTTPLVLAFDGAPVQLAEPGPETFAFTAGSPVHSSWPRAKNPWLVRDLDGNGRIDDGSELFGSDTLLSSGARARHGFAALAELDADGDGQVDARDPAFRTLRLWADADGDRRSQKGELRTLEEAGVASLSVRYAVAPRCDRRGNCERERAAFAWRDRAGWARTGAVIDVYLATRPALLGPGALTCRY